MNAKAIITRANGSFLKVIDQVDGAIVNKSGACGEWSIKDILAHITKYEELFIEVFQGQLDGGETVPSLVRMGNDHDRFNQLGVDEGEKRSLEELRNIYLKRADNVSELLTELDPKRLQKVGTIPWYNKEYSIDDLIVVLYYGHKKEHGAQVNLFKSMSKNSSQVI